MDTIIIIFILICSCLVISLIIAGIIYKTKLYWYIFTLPAILQTTTTTIPNINNKKNVDIAGNFSFKKNNGSISGDAYCKGPFENRNISINKNLKCKGGKNMIDNTDINCNAVYGHDNLAYDCYGDLFTYKGNNGSVSGDEYCKGSYESNIAKTTINGNKYLKCDGGINTIDNTDVNCTSVYGSGHGLQYSCGRWLTEAEML